MPFRWVRLIWVAVYIGQDVAFTVYRNFYLKQCDNVSWSAHFGGLLTGMFLGLFVLRNLVVHKWEQYLQYAALAVYIFIFGAFVSVAIFQSPDRAPLITCLNE